MPLTNQQYDSIMNEYDEIRSINRDILNERFKEVYKLSPRIKEIDDEIVSVSVNAIRDRITNNSQSSHKDKLKLLEQEKIQCLRNISKPDNYLMPIYCCNICKDTGYVDQSHCNCFKKRAIDLLYSDSNLKNITASENFDNFSFKWYSNDYIDESVGITPLENAKQAVTTAKAFVNNFDNDFSNLLILGEPGTGKTFLTNCIAKELLDNSHSVIYLTAIELFTKLSEKDKESYSYKTDYNNQSASSFDINHLFECDLLIIDDLGTELDTAYTTSKLFYIINERILRQKSVLISTNLSLSALRDKYTERVTSRFTGYYKLIKLVGDDIRISKLQLFTN